MQQGAAVVGLIALAALAGGMGFFGAVVAPLVFRTLEPPTSGRFIRALFPHYYRFTFIASAIAAIGLYPIVPWCAAVLALTALTTLWLWLSLMPRINLLRDSGQEAAFSRAHRLSVIVNQLELLIAVAILVRVGLLL
ncbi:MAG TPA: DUF4149 domain-containing protein [Acetobacteraceae bacterium]|nr:DUF4149 domain-containing protein [Acetobacteraceae bacterium]